MKQIISKTPMRITLGGGGTDVYWYSKLRGGAWISAAINKFVYVQIKNSLPKNFLKIDNNGQNYLYQNFRQLDNKIVKECLKKFNVKGGLEIATFSDVPPKSGLGGSGAFEVGLLNALYRYFSKPVTSLSLAKEAAAIEIQKLKKPVGPQDQYITALGGINYFEIDKNGNISIEQLNLSEDSLEELESNLLFFQTPFTHETAQILGDEKASTSASQQVIKSLDQIKQLGQQVKKYLLLGKINDFGQSLHEHWLIKKRLSSKISNPQIDQWYETGIKNGALGGKIIGAGGGGWLVFYVNKNKNKFIAKMAGIGLIYQQASLYFKGSHLLKNMELPNSLKPEKNGVTSVNTQKLADSPDSFINEYLGGALSATYQLDKETIKQMILKLAALKKNKGRLFLLGVGGSAANCSHAVNDFRKIAGIETYAPTDNVAELTARANDDGWETIFINWLKGSNLTKNDAVMVFSVGGGNLEKNVSINIVEALKYSKEIGAVILGIVSRDGGYTKKVADHCLLIPVISEKNITPFAESFQALIWHLFVFSPQLKNS